MSHAVACHISVSANLLGEFTLAVQEGLHAAYQKAVQEKRLAQEVAVSKRERDFYLSRVAQAKKNDAIVARKRQVLHYSTWHH
jgi:hypothetical protein